MKIERRPLVVTSPQLNGAELKQHFCDQENHHAGGKGHVALIGRANHFQAEVRNAGKPHGANEEKTASNNVQFAVRMADCSPQPGKSAVDVQVCHGHVLALIVLEEGRLGLDLDATVLTLLTRTALIAGRGRRRYHAGVCCA